MLELVRVWHLPSTFLFKTKLDNLSTASLTVDNAQGIELGPVALDSM